MILLRRARFTIFLAPPPRFPTLSRKFRMIRGPLPTTNIKFSATYLIGLLTSGIPDMGQRVSTRPLRRLLFLRCLRKWLPALKLPRTQRRLLKMSTSVSLPDGNDRMGGGWLSFRRVI